MSPHPRNTRTTHSEQGHGAADDRREGTVINVASFAGWHFSYLTGPAYIASKAGYRRVVLELGGNDPIIVMEDADLEEAASLAVSGSYKNSGQRCTAIKRMFVQSAVAEE